MRFGAETVVLLGLLGIAVGAIGTIVGAGGGFLLAPVLLIIYPHDNPRTLTAISLAAVWANSTSGSIAYARQRRIDFRSGLVFGAATLPGAVVGALVVGDVPRRTFNALMAVTLGAIAVWIALHRGRSSAARRQGVERVIVDRTGKEWRYRVPLVRGVVYSAFVGFVSSFLGIGGGVFHVPLLVAGLGYPTHIATATSHFVLSMMSGAGVITHLVERSYSVGNGLRRSLILAVGVAGGAQIGARLSTQVSGQLIERLLAVALAIVSVRLGWAAFS